MTVWDVLDTAIKVIAPASLTAWVALRISKLSRRHEAKKEAVRRRHDLLEELAEQFEDFDSKIVDAAKAAGFLPVGPPSEKVFKLADAATQARTFQLMIEAETRLIRTRTRLKLQKFLGCESVLYEYVIAAAKFRDSRNDVEREERKKIWVKAGEDFRETLARTYDELEAEILGTRRQVIAGRYGDPKFDILKK
jgi:hypothetical protein